MKKLQKILGILTFAIAVFLFIPAVTAKADGLTGLYPGNDGNWYYYTDGQVNANYTNLVANEAGWWYVENGCINTGYTGLVSSPEYGWWYVENGAINFGYTGLFCSPEYGWWYIENGAINFGYTGLVPNEYGWWYVENGTIAFWYTGLVCSPEYGWWYVENGGINFGYNGLVPNEAGWWLVENGGINFGYNGLVPNEAGWWLVENGYINFGYSGLVPNEYGWWLVENGAINFGFTGMVANEAGWWYVENGGINFGFTGLCANEAGTWYFRNGMLDFSYSGVVTVNGARNTVTNGMVTGVQQLTCNLPEHSEFYKYEYAYKNNDTSGLSEEDMAFYNGFKEYLDYAYQFDTLYEQERAIHDYMLLNCAYDYDNYLNNTIPWVSYWEEGVIANKTAVCNGYAYAFKLFMNVLGIECKVVSSSAMNHAWNAIMLDNEWYWVDVTWDDPVPDEQGRTRYAYFNLPEEVMRESHTYESDIVATGMKYSGDAVLVITPDADFNAVNTWLKQVYMQSEGKTLVRIFVKKADGSELAEEEYSEVYNKLNDLPYAKGFNREYSGYDYGTVYMHTLIAKSGEKLLKEITSDTSPAELREMAAQLNETLSSDAALMIELALTDGSTFGTKEDYYNSEVYDKYYEALVPYFAVTQSYMDETHMVFSCRKYDNVAVNTYRLKDARSVNDVDIAAFLQYLNACAVNDKINIVLENTQWENSEINYFMKECIPSYAITQNRRGWKYEDGSMIIQLTKAADIEAAHLVKDSRCTLWPFNEYYKYEYAYKANDTSVLMAEDMAFYNGLKEYLDYANQFTTDYEREKAIFEYMIQNCYKDYTYEEETYGAYAVFVNKRANGEGYNESFKLCMDILGIECVRVQGDVYSVCLDGKQYYVGVAWADNNVEESNYDRNFVDYCYWNVPLSALIWNSETVEIDVNDYYLNDSVTISSTEDTTELEAIMKDAFNRKSLDTTFLRILVKKADGSAWTEEQARNYSSLLGKSNYAYAYDRTWEIVNEDALLIEMDGYYLPPTEILLKTDATVEEVDRKLISAFEASQETYGLTICLEKADGTDWKDYEEVYTTRNRLVGVSNSLYSFYLICLDGKTAVFYYRPQNVQLMEYTISGAKSVASIDLSELVTGCEAKLSNGDIIILQLKASEAVTWDYNAMSELSRRIDKIESISSLRGINKQYNDGNAAMVRYYEKEE